VRHGIGREEYVRLICNGYLIMGKPIPEQFWDEWDAICAKQAEERSAEQRLLEIPPDPLEVWAFMEDGGKFMLTPTGPATNTVILGANVPYTGVLRYFRLQRPDGTLLAQFDGDMNTRALLAGDSLLLQLDAEQMLKFLT
jgi:hypothetical protein